VATHQHRPTRCLPIARVPVSVAKAAPASLSLSHPHTDARVCLCEQYLLHRSLLDDAHAAQAVAVARPAALHVLQEEQVYVKDDLEMPVKR
jgi:hypothetical protein